MVFPSFYEMSNPLTTVRKQHFWEWFSGDSLQNNWTTNVFTSAPTFRMSDTVDGGFEIVTAATNNTGGSIISNGKRQFSETGSVAIWITQDVDNKNTLGGLMNDHTAFSNFRNCAYIRSQNGEGTLFCDTGDSSAATQTNMITTPAATTRTYKIECKASSVEASIAGVVEATPTTNLPVAKLGARLGYRATSAATSTGRFRYFEAYNT